MKSKLIFLLSIVAMTPIIATSFASDEKEVVGMPASKEEALKCAKKVKASIEKLLQGSNDDWKEIEQEHSSQLVKQIKDIWNEIHAILIKPEEFEIAVNSYCEWAFDPVAVHLAMHKKESIKEGEFLFYLPFEMFESPIFTMNVLYYSDLQEEQKQRIKSIFIKYGKDHSLSLNEMLDDFFNSTYETAEMCIGMDLERFFSQLLPKLDAKIKELETQIAKKIPA